MVAALFYLQTRSIWNGLRVRARRLKQPKYLVGAIVGLAYFGWYFFGMAFAPWGASRNRVMGDASVRGNETWRLIAPLGLAAWTLLSWFLPNARAALAFTEAEVAFLFPAPFTRRMLIQYKLLKSQLGLLFTSLFFSLLGGGLLRGKAWWFSLAGWWIVLFTLNLHGMAASFTLARLFEHGLTNWRRRLLVALLVLSLLGGLFVWGRSHLPNFGTPQTAEEFLEQLRGLAASPPVQWALLPFRIVAAPWFARDLPAFLRAVWPALLVLGLHYLWVIRSEVSFEEGSLAFSQKRAKAMAAARAGNWQAAQTPRKAKRAPFELRPTGFAPMALLWKNLIGAGGLFARRIWLAMLVWIVVIGVINGMAMKGGGLLGVVAMISFIAFVMSVFAGAQFFRNDLRQDLAAADVLKALPMPGWQVVLGELLAPIVMLTLAQYALISLFLAVSGGVPEVNRLGPLPRSALALTLACALPGLNAVTFFIPNAAALLFPAWFATGKDGPAGFEVLGQRLVFMFGQVIVMLVSLVPAALFFGLGFFALKWMVGPWVAAPVGGLAAGVALSAEAALGIWWLGRRFEHFDLTQD
jgi:hypothetical protein